LLELRANQFGAIDFNPRPFGWMTLAVAAGANLPALWCDHVLGRRTGTQAHEARAGVHYRWEEGELRNALGHLRRGRLRAALAVLRPYRRVAHALFRIDDPAPLLARVLSAARRRRR
jgi:predicted ATP-grasp superfamily ATP-dependent carboligase